MVSCVKRKGKWRFLIKEDSSSAFRCNKTTSRGAKSERWIKNLPGDESEGNRLILALLCFTATSRRPCTYRSSLVMYGFDFGKLKPLNSLNSYAMSLKGNDFICSTSSNNSLSHDNSKDSTTKCNFPLHLQRSSFIKVPLLWNILKQQNPAIEQSESCKAKFH